MSTKSKPKIYHRSPHAEALDAWWFEEGKKSSDASTLGISNPNYYLGNRLKRAFMAGMKAAEIIAAAPPKIDPRPGL